MINQEDHDQILADPNATADELRSIIAELQAELAAAQATNERLREALKRIVEWGPFPPTGKYWDDPNGCQPMSYSAAYGSNGERDFMRSVAATALSLPNDTTALDARLKDEVAQMVERLRHADENSIQRTNGSRIFGEAADLIERLARSK